VYRSSTMGRRSGRILLVVALFELALAGGSVLVVGLVPGAREGMLIAAGILGSTGIVLVVVAIVLLRRAAATDRISAMGVAGTGQIMGLRQTGVLINGQPQVEMDLLVTVMGQSPYRAKVKEIVPLIMLNRLQGTLPVRVDPARPQTVVVQWDQPNVGVANRGAGSGPA
jgi:hypothetical protein